MHHLYLGTGQLISFLNNLECSSDEIPRNSQPFMASETRGSWRVTHLEQKEAGLSLPGLKTAILLCTILIILWSLELRKLSQTPSGIRKVSGRKQGNEVHHEGNCSQMAPCSNTSLTSQRFQITCFVNELEIFKSLCSTLPYSGLLYFSSLS